MGCLIEALAQISDLIFGLEAIHFMYKKGSQLIRSSILATSQIQMSFWL